MLNALFSWIVFGALVYGIGSLIVYATGGDEPSKRGAAYHVLLRVLLGMTVLAVVGWWLGILGIATVITDAILLLAAITGIATEVRHRGRGLREVFTPGRTGSLVQGVIRSAPIEVALVIAFSGPLIAAGLSPFVDGDAIYSWNTWAQHWSVRAYMGDYIFAYYGQLVPIVSAYLYRIRGTGLDALPDEQFVLHGAHAVLALLTLLAMVGLVRSIVPGRRGYVVGGLCAFLLYAQPDLHTSSTSGRVEGTLAAFVVLLLFETIELARSPMPSLGAWTRYGLLLGGLAFTKATGMEWSVALPVALAVHAFAPRLFRLVRPVIAARVALRGCVVALAIAAAIVVPFYTQQGGLWGVIGFTNPLNQSPNPAVLAGLESVSLNDNASDMRAHGITSTRVYAVVRFAELYTPLEQRAKPIPNELGPRALRLAEYALPFVALILALIALFDGTGLVLAIPLALATLIWWRTFSYGDYNLAAEMPVASLVVGLGLLRVTESTRVRHLFRSGRQSSRSAAATRNARFFSSAAPLLVAAIIVATGVGSFRQVSEVVDNHGYFWRLSNQERVASFFPNVAPGVDLARQVESAQLEPSNWRKFLIAAPNPWVKFVPNAFHIQWLTAAGSFYPELIQRAAEGEFTILSEGHRPGSILVDGIWIQPARRLFTPVAVAPRELGDGVAVPVGPLARGSQMLLAIDVDTCATDLESELASLGGPVVTNGSWIYTVAPRSDWDLPGAATTSGWKPVRIIGSYGDPPRTRVQGMPDETSANWIWGDAADASHKTPDSFYFRYVVRGVTRQPYRIAVSGDDGYELFVNGQLVGSGASWTVATPVVRELADGDVLAIRAWDEAGVGAVLVDASPISVDASSLHVEGAIQIDTCHRSYNLVRPGGLPYRVVPGTNLGFVQLPKKIVEGATSITYFAPPAGPGG